MKFIGNNHLPVPMTYFDFGGQMSRLQQAIEVVKASILMWGRQNTSSFLFDVVQWWIKLATYDHHFMSCSI